MKLGMVAMAWLAALAPASAVPAEPAKPAGNSPATAALCVEPPRTGLCIVDNATFVVADDGSLSAPLRLCNVGTEPAPLALGLSGFRGDPQEAPVLMATRQLIAESVKAKALLDGQGALGPGHCIDLKLQAAKLNHAGLLVATLMNGPQPVATVNAVRHSMPFKVRVLGTTPEKATASFTQGSPGTIRLHNEDATGYSLRWRFELGDVVREGSTWIGPHGEANLPITLEPDSIKLLESGFLRSGLQTGRLVLEHDAAPGLRHLDWPRQSYPVEAQLHYWPGYKQYLYTTAFILGVLALGILASLLVNFLLPTQRKRIDIKQRLARQEGRLAVMSGLVSSRILNLLRAEKRRLRAELRSLWPVWPTSEEGLKRLVTDLEALEQRINVTVRAGELQQTVGFPQRLAQPEADTIRAACETALDVITEPEAQPEDLKRAEAELVLAHKVLDASRLPPSAEVLATLDMRSLELPQALPYDAQDAVQVQDWGPFDDLLQALRLDFTLPKDANREDYVRASCAVAKAALICRFKRLVDNAGHDDVRKRRLKRSGPLLQALLPGPHESIETARVIVAEAAQSIDVDAVIAAISPSTPLKVSVNTQTPLPRQMVTFRVCMPQPGLDRALARKDIECRWSINGHALQEEPEDTDGWILSTFFEKPPGVAFERRQGEALYLAAMRWCKQWLKRRLGLASPDAAAYRVEARLSRAGQPLGDPIAAPPVTLEKTKSYGASVNTYTALTLLITIGAVGLGLLAGARDKLQAMDWIAGVGTLLVLGFGADIVKRMLTR